MKINNEMGMVMQEDDGPVVRVLNHRMLGTGEKKGLVDGPARGMPLVINSKMFAVLINGAKKMDRIRQAPAQYFHENQS